MYFEEHYGDLDFSDLLFSEEEGNIYYYLIFEYEVPDVLSSFGKQEIFLCKDGKLRKLDEAQIKKEAFLVYSRDRLIELIKKCNTRLEDICVKQGLAHPIIGLCFIGELRRNGKPSHLFTKDEIESLMRNADDGKNNMLVIDENGYAKIIQDIGLGFYYPVRLESWCAGNNYMGKNADLSDLDDTYRLALEGWYEYLTYGRSEYKDYQRNDLQIEELIQKIKEFYN